MRHRHERTSWLLIGGSGGWEWCYQCGAHRSLKSTGPNSMMPTGKWVKPTGLDGPNPALSDTPGEEAK